MRVLISWLGRADLTAALQRAAAEEPGPVLRLLQAERFDRVHLLHDFDEQNGSVKKAATPTNFAVWLAAQAGVDKSAIRLHAAPKPLHNDYSDVYEFTAREIKRICEDCGSAVRFAALLSPGNAAAQAAMLIASQTLFPQAKIEVFNTSRERGVERVDPIFRLQADVVPLALRHLRLDVLDVPPSPAFNGIIGESKALATVKEMAQRVASYDEPVILTGETGTGKELFARAIHAASLRSKGPFIALHCAALAPTLLESELFGHKRGAFSGATENRKGKLAQADQGTLFLDEIGDVPLAAQVALLRFLNDGTYEAVGSDKQSHANVRVIAATHRDLERGIAEGRFRDDLYYRLAGAVIELPPLRNRGGDVRLLAEFFLNEFNTKYNTKKRLSDDAVRLLGRHPWHGNVRELKSAVSRAAMFGGEDEIQAEIIAALLVDNRRGGLRPLADLSPHDFAAHLIAVLDELLTRFKKPGHLPWALAENAQMMKDLLEPLIFCRAMKLAPNQRQAGRLFQTTGLDMKDKTDESRVKRGDELAGAVDMTLVSQIRNSVRREE